MECIAASQNASWMNRVSKACRLILPPSDALIETLLSDSRAKVVYVTEDLCVLEGADRTLAEGLRMGCTSWTRVFEEYYLVSTGEDKAQATLVGAFFDWMAERYNDEIEPARNIACYEELYDIASKLRGPAGATVVLDVGCGPGTILRSRVAAAAKLLVGFDISDVVAKTAALKGLTVIPREHFLEGLARFDVALSAYTMHYACDLTDTLSGVQCSLKPGGVWALNFHKDIGLEAFLKRLDSTTLELTTQVRNSTFGSIVTVTKPADE